MTGQIELQQGKKYSLDDLKVIGWTEGDGTGSEGYHASMYFTPSGEYLGADQHGIEPVLAKKEQA